MSRHSPPRSAQIFSSSDPCCTTIPKGQRRGSVQQRCCVGCAPQKLSFVRRIHFLMFRLEDALKNHHPTNDRPIDSNRGGKEPWLSLLQPRSVMPLQR